MTLPVEAIREQVLSKVRQGPLILTAETGSGKSTQVPRWFRESGAVLVIEPRRVACRSLAKYVSTLEQSQLGQVVGYVHRHQEKRSGATRILYVTPGVALRFFSTGAIDEFSPVILDEFHERTQEIDLLFALLAEKKSRQWIVMSATLEQRGIERFLQAETLHASGRIHPVEVQYTGCAMLPSADQLARRVRSAVTQALQYPGDVLVFLPGAREIKEALQACQSLPGIECLPLYGGLSSAAQDRCFQDSSVKRVVFATNVAETSVTLPRIGVVVDTGLVRRTLYRWGSASLGLVPIASDSATQRQGRAGRLGPGICLRMWSEAGLLEARTPPEIHREPLEGLILRAAVAGTRLDTLRMLDPPQPYALEHALAELRFMGAVDQEGEITPRGVAMARLPFSPFLAALREVGKGAGMGSVATDLAAALAAPPWMPGPTERQAFGDGEGFLDDASTLLRALRTEEALWETPPPSGYREAKKTAARLRPKGAESEDYDPRCVEPNSIASLALKAHPRMGFVRRAKGDKEVFTNGGSEVRPDRKVALPEGCQAFVALGIRAIEGRRGTDLLASCVVPVSLGFLAESGLGTRRFSAVEYTHGRLEAIWETVYAGRVLKKEEGIPTGEMLVAAVAALIWRGKLFPRVRKELPFLWERTSLAQSLKALNEGREADLHPSVEAWLLDRLRGVGIHDPEDLALLDAEDLMPNSLEAWELEELNKLFPSKVPTPQGTFTATYDAGAKTVILKAPAGQKKPPSRRDLPRFEGWKMVCRLKNRDVSV